MLIISTGAQHHENPNETHRGPSLVPERNTSPDQIEARRQRDKIEQVVSMTEEKLAGNRMLNFRCQSEINGELKPFEIKFELGTQVVSV